MYARATVLFFSSSVGQKINLLQKVPQGFPDVLFNGAIGEEIFSDPELFIKKLTEMGYVFDGCKMWYQNNRWKLNDDLSRKLTYADGDMIIKSGETSWTIPISHSLSNFSNIPEQIDMPMQEAIEVKEDMSISITPNAQEGGKIILFFGVKADWKNKDGMPKMQTIVVKEGDGNLNLGGFDPGVKVDEESKDQKEDSK